MTIDDIKNDILQNYKNYRIVDKKATRNYPRTLWLYKKNPQPDEPLNNHFIPNNDDMITHYNDFINLIYKFN